MFEFCNKYTGRNWWIAVEILGAVVLALAVCMALPCLDLIWDTRHSFGAARIIGQMFSTTNPLRVIVYGRWVVSDQDSIWIYFAALFGLSILSKIGFLMMMLGDHYARGMVCKLIRPHWLLPVRVWVKPD
jgi:hypothetical protein